ncbi:MAG: hypothetical protein V4543_16815 [Bacteroidota bacterium]
MRFLRNSLPSLGSVTIRAAAALLMQKAVALYFGPAGIALFAHFQNLTGLFIALPNDGVNRGLIKHAAPDESKASFNTWFKAGLLWNFACWLIACLVLFVFRNSILREFSANSDLRIWTALFFCFEGLYLLHLYLMAIMLARLEIKLQTGFNIAGSLLQLSLLYSALQFGSLEWVFIGVAAGQGLIAAGSFAWAFNQGFFKGVLAKSINLKPALKGIGRFVLLALVIAAFGRLVDFFVRQYAINHFQAYETGLWQSVVKLSDAYMTPVTAIIGTAFYPAASNLINKPKELRAYLRETFRLVIPVSIFGLVLVYFLRVPLLVFLNDNRFAPAASLTPFQLAGDFFKIISYFLANILLVRSKLKTTVILEAVSAGLYLLVIALLIPRMGTEGFVAAHFCKYIVYCSALVFIEIKNSDSYNDVTNLG